MNIIKYLLPPYNSSINLQIFVYTNSKNVKACHILPLLKERLFSNHISFLYFIWMVHFGKSFTIPLIDKDLNPSKFKCPFYKYQSHLSSLKCGWKHLLISVLMSMRNFWFFNIWTFAINLSFLFHKINVKSSCGWYSPFLTIV